MASATAVTDRSGPPPSGAGGAPPRVLFLHGMGNTGAIWDSVRARLPGGADMCAPDLPWAGVGAPEWSHHPDPTVWLRRAVEDARRTLGGLDVVVAHSFSATVLVNLLAGPPADGADAAPAGHRLGGLVLLGPFYRPSPEDFDWEIMATLVEAFHRTMQEGIRLVAGARGNPELQGAMARKVCERIGPYGWIRFVEQYLATPFASTSRIDLPCLVVSGGLDVTAPAAEAAALAAALPSARLWSLAGQGHFPMLEAADELAAGLGEFLDQVRSTGNPVRTTSESELLR